MMVDLVAEAAGTVAEVLMEKPAGYWVAAEGGRCIAHCSG